MLGYFRSKRKTIPNRSLDEIKGICKILFIDDKAFPIIEILEKNGWRNIVRLKDIEALDQIEVREAHILFVDIQGVGKKLKLPDEGLGLIIALKRKYPSKKIIAYSAEDQGHVSAFHQGLDIADSRMSKNANSYEFQFKIEKFAQEIFSFDACVERVKGMLSREMGNTPQSEEVIKMLEKLNKSGDFSTKNVSKIFNLQNASNLSSIIQLFFTGNVS